MSIQIELPDEVLSDTPEEFRIAVAARLYAMRKVSSGKAAELAGVSRVAFLHSLGRHGVPAFLDMSEEEIEQDVRCADPDR